MLSFEARVLLVQQVFHCGGEYTEVDNQKFTEMFAESNVPHRNTVRQLIETGSVSDELKSGRPRVLTEDKALDISGHIIQSPKMSISQIVTASRRLIIINTEFAWKITAPVSVQENINV
jgi:hypothetical protein